MPACFLVKTGRKQGYTIFSALPRTNCDGVLFKIEIPHPQLQAFMQPRNPALHGEKAQLVTQMSLFDAQRMHLLQKV